MTKVAVTVPPTWRLPHAFAHVRAAREKLPDPAPAFTYGLLLPEVLRVDALIDTRMRMRVGVPWLGTLLDRDTLGEREDPPKQAISRYFAERALEIELSGRVPLFPWALLDELASPAARVAQEEVARAFGRFAYDMNQAADHRQRPSQKLVSDARSILATHGPPISLLRHREPTGRIVYGFNARTLMQRLALEVHDLYLHRPTLRRCVFCGAVYVPRGKELNCRWTLWHARTHQPLAACATAEMVEQWNRIHKAPATSPGQRERKTIDKRVSRAAARARQNPDDVDAQDALQQALAQRAAFYKVHPHKTPGPLARYLQATVEIAPANASNATKSDRWHE